MSLPWYAKDSRFRKTLGVARQPTIAARRCPCSVEFAHPFDYNERAGSSSEPHRISPTPFDSLTLLNGVAASRGQD